MEKHGYKKHFGKNCVEGLVNETLEIDKKMKHYFGNNVELKPDTKPNKYREKISCW